MIHPNENESRIQYLSRVLLAFMQENPVSDYTIDYDDTTCDGACLAQDIADEASELEWEKAHKVKTELATDYMSRNMDVCLANGLSAGLRSVTDRLRSKADTPQWLLTKMDDMIERSNCLIPPLVRYRDELRIEADVPIPEPETIQGKVIKCQTT